jgi:hypothetical protein
LSNILIGTSSADTLEDVRSVAIRKIEELHNLLIDCMEYSFGEDYPITEIIELTNSVHSLLQTFVYLMELNKTGDKILPSPLRVND